MKKFLTIALLVMALCVVSVAVSATEFNETDKITTNFNSKTSVATVTVPGPSSAGQVVILAVQGEKLKTTYLTEQQLASTLADKIIYVDQTTATGNATFSFIPREVTTGTGETAVKAPYEGDVTVFSSDGTDVYTKTFATNIVNVTVTLDVNDGTLETTSYTVKANDETVITLPQTATKVGYVFGGWFTDENWTKEVKTFKGKDLETNVTYYAKWNPIFVSSDEFSDAEDHNNAEFDTDNENYTVADAGFVMNEDKKEYIVSVTAKVSNAIEVTDITGYGFYVFNADVKTIPPVVKVVNGQIPADKSFYARATGIPESAASTRIMFKPFVFKADGKVLWGTAATYSAADLKADNKAIAE